MAREFESIRLARQEAYLSRLAACPAITSDYSFINLYAWAEEYGLSWCWDDQLVLVRQARPVEMLWAPVGNWEGVDWQAWIRKLPVPGPAVFTRVPERLQEIWRTAFPSAVKGEEERGHFDYLYAAEDLKSLRGNRFHKKKNLRNQFVKQYAYIYRPLDAASIDHAIAMQGEWCGWRDCESSADLLAENQAVTRVFKGWKELAGICGGALWVDGEMVAYTVGEPLARGVLLIHFEKGSPRFKGVYQAINQMFLEHAGDGIQVVNRESDLDDPGLRKAKLSYHPIDFMKKYRVTIGG